MILKLNINDKAYDSRSICQVKERQKTIIEIIFNLEKYNT